MTLAPEEKFSDFFLLCFNSTYALAVSKGYSLNKSCFAKFVKADGFDLFVKGKLEVKMNKNEQVTDFLSLVCSIVTGFENCYHKVQAL